MIKKFSILIIAVLIILSSATCFAENVSGWRKFDAKYCTLYLNEGANPYRIDRDLNVHKIRVYSNPRIYKPTDKVIESLISKIDLIFSRVSEILDMKPDTNNVSIKFVRTKQELSDEYEKIFGEGRPLKAFYVRRLNTIFMSEQTASEDVLAHEIAHAIIDNYFVILPPQRVQEILSTYVDKELKR